MIKEIKSKTDFHFKMLPIFSFSVPAIDCIALFQDNTEKKLPIISKAVPDPIHLITIFDEQISQLFFSKMKRLQGQKSPTIQSFFNMAPPQKGLKS